MPELNGAQCPRQLSPLEQSLGQETNLSVWEGGEAWDGLDVPIVFHQAGAQGFLADCEPIPTYTPEQG